jgi:hypothetical protein
MGVARAAADPNLFVGASGNLLRWDPGAAVALTQSLGVSVYRISVLWSPGETTIGDDVSIQLRQAIDASQGARIVAPSTRPTGETRRRLTRRATSSAATSQT